MNSVPWDLLIRLDFARYVDTEKWKSIERTTPSGLTTAGLALAAPESLYLTEVVSQSPMRGARARAVYAVTTFQFNVDPSVGDGFLRSYAVPEMEAFVRDEVLTGYGLYLNLHDVGDWSYLALYEYADIDVFDRRSSLKSARRMPLSEQSDWKTLQGLKPQIRAVGRSVFAERILPP